MNKHQLLDLAIYPLSVIIISFTCILTILSTVGLHYYSVNPELFDDFIIPFDFLWFVTQSTFFLVIALFVLLFRRQHKRQGDDKN